uniref:Uncharacterized protein n=1 Tax=Anguilla anguilla TaxID=7936 RepID=A0A0E9XBV7_ANGAN
MAAWHFNIFIKKKNFCNVFKLKLEKIYFQFKLFLLINQIQPLMFESVIDYFI